MARMKRLFFYLLLAALPTFALAQKKAISQAKSYIKSGKDLDKAVRLMEDLLKDTTQRRNEKVWLTLGDAVKMQYDQGNQKLYLKQKYDTAALFGKAKDLFYIYEKFDSIDAMPNKKGKIVLKYRDKHAAVLNILRPNLYNGAAYHLRKFDFNNAWDFDDAYIDCCYQPLFSNYHYAENDTLLQKAAYRAFYSGYRLKDIDKMNKYLKLAEEDTTKLENIILYLAEIQLLNKDTTEYVASLKRGFKLSPSHPFFFPRLVDYYNAKQMSDSASIFIDNALASDSTNVLFLFAKSKALLNAQQYEHCLDVTSKLLEINDSMPEAYCNMGLAYYNQAVQLDKTMPRSRKKRKAVHELYEKSRPYMEKYRELAPTQQAKWVPALYTIYLYLNMGKEFEEIDKLRATLKL